MYTIKPFISKNFPVKEIDHKLGDVLLEKIISENNDPSLKKSNAQIAIVNEVVLGM